MATLCSLSDAMCSQQMRPPIWEVQTSYDRFPGTSLMYVCSVLIMTYVVVNTIRELLQLYQQRGGYLFDASNLVPWLLYFSATATVGPMFAGRLDAMQISCASLMVFLAWFNLLLFLQR